jgi:hypothetical protein
MISEDRSERMTASESEPSEHYKSKDRLREVGIFWCRLGSFSAELSWVDYSVENDFVTDLSGPNISKGGSTTPFWILSRSGQSRQFGSWRKELRREVSTGVGTFGKFEGGAIGKKVVSTEGSIVWDELDFETERSEKLCQALRASHRLQAVRLGPWSLQDMF